jgi:hypothetical protein
MKERTEKLRSAGKASLGAMRASDTDPAKSRRREPSEPHGHERSCSRIVLGNIEHGRTFDVERYKSEVLPRVLSMTIPALADATGLSSYYLWRIKKGERRLHPRHWASLG